MGIGAKTAAFGVAYAVLFRPLPVRDPASLAVVQQHRGGWQYSMLYPAFSYLRDHTTQAVEAIIAFRDNAVTVNVDGTTERVTGLLVTGNGPRERQGEDCPAAS